MELYLAGPDGGRVTEVRVPGPLPLPIVVPERDAVIREITVEPAGALATRWTPRVPPGGLSVRGGSAWRLLGPVSAEPSDVPAEPAVLTWTITYEYEGGNRRMAESRVTVTPESRPDLDVNSGWIALDYGTSTTSITLFDQRRQHALIGFPPSQREVLRRELTLRFDGHAGYGLDGQSWQRFLAATGSTLATAGGTADPLQAARAVLDNDTSTSGAGLYRLLLTMERQAAQVRQPIVSQALQGLYRAAFDVPPIREQRMIRIPLHAGEETIDSEIAVHGLDPLTVSMAADGRRSGGSAEPLAPEVRSQRSLKQFIGSSRSLPGLPAGHPVTPDDVIAAAWAGLMTEKVAKYCHDHPDEVSTKPITHAVVTYPTVSPPRIRQDVERLARRIGMRQVVTAYDEATAAAMFYLMRDFAGDQAVGIEAFRAHTRRVGDKQWHRNILVVDIGGGTTDIALLGITLLDQTVYGTGRDERVQGRYYALRPAVLAKAGRAQLGGDRITLGVFKHLKALLADAVLTRSPRLVREEYPGYLTGGVYNPGSLLAPAPGPDAEQRRADLIEKVVPTRWASAAGDRHAAEERFRRLWSQADLAKRQQSTHEGDYVVRRVPELLQLEGRAREITEPAEVVVKREEINRIIEEVVRDAFAIALSVVKRRLGRDEKGVPDVLDKVVISGGTSALPQVRRVLLETFAQAGDHVNWNPLDVVYDPAFAKTGTSIGACWAEHVRQKGYASASQATQRVRRGLTELYIDVDNLFHALPNTLVFDATGGQLFPIFQVGERFDRIQVDGEIEGRRRYGDWIPVPQDMAIYRQPFAVEEERSLWSHLSTHGLLDGRVPPEQQADWYRQVMVTFEVNERELVTAHFCHHSGPVYAPRFGSAPATRGLVARDEAGRFVLQRDIVVNPYTAGGLASAPQPIFRAGTVLTERLLTDNGRHAAGLIGRPLPKDVPGDGLWTFYTPEPGRPDALTQIGESVRAPKAGLLGADMVPVLDSEGRLTVEPGYVRFREAKSPADVVADPGSVFSVAMAPGDPDVDEKLNPFTGGH
ncbi:Hsp70 family protein [Herbidospora cretacea]|uniref:Hsp70 family protein n=1 Tax=Herbidospora cretacea TaxID=28444 RepID=UPI0004C33326|nr:Hsp70 family protein [Herbidospora cretacea]